MGQALYRKYRSRKLSEVIGQEHITRALGAALKSGHLSHAYLFTGPKGVGKTSVARILAHEINKLPYADDAPHIDIIEIDAASNNGVEDVRDLREKLYVAPASAAYKVYIIDEVHMLSKAAFNALLKTLEEPPAHVVFILATTEAHKLPETIISRTQRFVFRPIEPAKVRAHLQDIAQHERITITDDALQLIAEHGEGSFRDSIGLLDQASGQGGTIDAAAVQAMLGMPPKQAIADLLTYIEQGSDITASITLLNDLFAHGFQATAIARQLSVLIREQLVAKTFTGDLAAATGLLASLLEVPVSHDPERFLEIIVLRSLRMPPKAPAAVTAPTLKQSDSSNTPAPVTPVQPAQAKTEIKPSHEPTHSPKASKSPASTPKTAAAATKVPLAEAEPSLEHPTAVFDETVWPQVLAALKTRYNTLYSIARMAKPLITGDNSLELVFAFAFHQKRLNEAKNRKIVSDAITAITGKPVDITCSLDPNLKLSRAPTAAEGPAAQANSPDPSLATISNIFGGGELLQS
ncbi:MAG TPA: DNA polymerase III subunit gamma/tau [Candidatus Saccharimonadales bacterium]